MKGVLWDILMVLHFRAGQSKGGSRIDFVVLIWDKDICKDVLTSLYSMVGPGDEMEPVITIMLPEED